MGLTARVRSKSIYRKCWNCKKEIVKNIKLEDNFYCVIELCNLSRPMPSTLWFHLGCFAEVAGREFVDLLHEEQELKYGKKVIDEYIKS